MRVLFAVLLACAACGPNSREQIDASTTPTADAAPDAPPDAPFVACTHVASTSTSPLISFTYSGGSFGSFGCAPIDPTRWLAGAGMSVTVTFAQPQIDPQIRVWGMNTDDTASVLVNGTAYTLDGTSAKLAPKVVCGLSPGPDGVAFPGGNLAGANTPAEGNYAYQDITVDATGVQSIKITGLSGAGWGFAGASIGCADGPVNPQ